MFFLYIGYNDLIAGLVQRRLKVGTMYLDKAIILIAYVTRSLNYILHMSFIVTWNSGYELYNSLYIIIELYMKRYSRL